MFVDFHDWFCSTWLQYCIAHLSSQQCLFCIKVANTIIWHQALQEVAWELNQRVYDPVILLSVLCICTNKISCVTQKEISLLLLLAYFFFCIPPGPAGTLDVELLSCIGQAFGTTLKAFSAMVICFLWSYKLNAFSVAWSLSLSCSCEHCKLPWPFPQGKILFPGYNEWLVQSSCDTFAP